MILERRYSSSLIILNSDQSNELINSSTYSQDSNSLKTGAEEEHQEERALLSSHENNSSNINDDSTTCNSNNNSNNSNNNTEGADKTNYYFNKNNMRQYRSNSLKYEAKLCSDLNENLYSSETNSASNSPHFQNPIYYKKLFNVNAKNNNEDNGGNNSSSIGDSTNNNDRVSIQQRMNDDKLDQANRLQFSNHENSSSIYGYDATSMQRDPETCAYEAGTQAISNPQIMDSLSTLSDRKKRVIVRIVTIFSIILFLICFGMIALTLRMSEKIDAQIRKGFGANLEPPVNTNRSRTLLNTNEEDRRLSTDFSRTTIATTLFVLANNILFNNETTSNNPSNAQNG